jgi:hypothetical protein
VRVGLHRDEENGEIPVPRWWPCLVAIAVLLVACGPSPRLPITGEISLEFVRKNSSGVRFKLKNQTPKRISFSGIDEGPTGAFPQAPRMKCFRPNSDQMEEDPYPFIDGPQWEDLVIESGEELDVTIGTTFIPEPVRGLPGARCRFWLELYGGAIIESDEFQP